MTEYPVFNLPDDFSIREKSVAKRRYPFKEMQVRQSFIVRKEEGRSLKSLQNLCTYWNKKAKEEGLPNRFTAFINDDGNIQVVRKT